MAECLFCRIVARQIPASIVHETENSLAFRDIHPRAPVHVLVIPKAHIGSMLDLTADHAAVLSDLHQTIQAVAKQEKAGASGFRVVVNNGPDSGQEVQHLHYHVLAGRRFGWPAG